MIFSGNTPRRGPCCSFSLLLALLAALTSTNSLAISSAPAKQEPERWIGTWAAAPQPFLLEGAPTFRDETIRLIVHISAGGAKVRIKISNGFGNDPLIIGSAHLARRAEGANIDPTSDRALKFQGRSSVTIAAKSTIVSDPVELEVPALSDLAISLFLPQTTKATTMHVLAMQTNYISSEAGDSTAMANFQIGKTMTAWPFVTGVDVAGSPHAATIVAFGSSLTDGDGSTKDTNRRWPDVLAERLQKAWGREAELGVLNEGIIGNRLLSDSSSPRQAGGPPPLGAVFAVMGPTLGESGLTRFERDVLAQAGVKYVILAIGVNDILFPGSFIPASESVNSQRIISGYREFLMRAHKKGIRVIGTTIPPFEHAIFREPYFDGFYTAEKEQVRQESMPGFSVRVNLTASSILTRQCVIPTTSRKYCPAMTAETTCTSTTKEMSHKGTRFRLPYSARPESMPGHFKRTPTF